MTTGPGSIAPKVPRDDVRKLAYTIAAAAVKTAVANCPIDFPNEDERTTKQVTWGLRRFLNEIAEELEQKGIQEADL